MSDDLGPASTESSGVVPVSDSFRTVPVSDFGGCPRFGLNTFETYVDLPEAAADDAALPKPSDGSEAYLRHLGTLRPLCNIVLSPSEAKG